MQKLIKQYFSKQELNEILLDTIQAIDLDLPMVQQLLKADADPNYTDNFDGCLLDNIFWNHESDKKIELLKILLAYGANPNFRLYSNMSHQGCLLHNVNISIEVIQLLREHGAIPDIKLQNTKNYPPFVRGRKNPERVQDNFFEYMISTGQSPYGLRKYIKDLNRERPTGTKRKRKKTYAQIKDFEISKNDLIWHYHRFGMSSTILPDGSVVHIGGEHEDFYDPDFCIFNDVLKVDPNGKMELYFYSEKAFPPTDFHSATLYEDTIIIIGGLGYMNQRQDGVTKVFSLNLDGFSMSEWRTKGENPGWVYKHTAVADLENDRILVFGGSSTAEKNCRAYIVSI